MIALETVDLDLVDDPADFAAQIHAGKPTHWLKCHKAHPKDASTQELFDSLQESFLQFLEDLRSQCGPISTFFCIWPHCGDYPEIHAFLRIPPQDSPPIRTIHRLETPLVFSTKTLAGFEHTLISAYARNLQCSGHGLNIIATYIDPLQKTVDWRL